jgi:hypothetical protein
MTTPEPHVSRLTAKVATVFVVALLWAAGATTMPLGTAANPGPSGAADGSSPGSDVLGQTGAPLIGGAGPSGVAAAADRLPGAGPARPSQAANGSGTPGSTSSPTGSPDPGPTPSPTPWFGPTPTPGPGSTPTPSPTPMPTTGPTPRPRPPTTVTIVAAGDIACDPASNVGMPKYCDQAATANLIGQLGPNAVLTLGDNQYENGTAAAFKSVYGASWGKYRSITYPAIGNHEYLTAGAAGYFGYFGVPSYYSFDLGDWHLISLNSECHFVGGCQAGSAQERWLVADLAAHPTRCTLVYWHEPRWSSGEHGDATQMTAIWNDLVAAHVDVVMSGHNHDYERFVALDAAGQPSSGGVTEFVVGTGGKNHYAFTAPALTGEVVRNDTSSGVIEMSLGPTGYSWRFVPAPGYTFADSGSAACV